ncbi:gag-pol polyprotein [Tanacetum coccineum]
MDTSLETTIETPQFTVFEATPTVTQSFYEDEVIVGPLPSSRPKHNCKSTKRDDFVYSCYSSTFSSFIDFVHRLHKPVSYREVVYGPLWQVAMAEELAALHHIKMWNLVPLSIGKRAIGSRWFYKIKSKSDGSIERYKARLVAKGYSQKYGMDNEETYAHVANMTTFKCGRI